jgi:hypothetical protein
LIDGVSSATSRSDAPAFGRKIAGFEFRDAGGERPDGCLHFHTKAAERAANLTACDW